MIDSSTHAYLEQQHLDVNNLLLCALSEIALQEARHVHELVVRLTRKEYAPDADSERRSLYPICT
jgi:hypothetical protein